MYLHLEKLMISENFFKDCEVKKILYARHILFIFWEDETKIILVFIKKIIVFGSWLGSCFELNFFNLTKKKTSCFDFARFPMP